MRHAVVVATLILVAGWPHLANTCSKICVTDLQGDIDNADWVLVGRVVKIAWDPEMALQSGVASVEPLTIYKGQPKPVYQVETGSSAACLFPMREGEEYLLFLHRGIASEAPLSVSGCSNGLAAESESRLQQLRPHARWSIAVRYGVPRVAPGPE
jgi:hypothetical protein